MLKLTVTMFDSHFTECGNASTDVLNFKTKRSARKVICQKIGQCAINGFKITEMAMDEEGFPFRVYMEKDIFEAVLLKVTE